MPRVDYNDVIDELDDVINSGMVIGCEELDMYKEPNIDSDIVYVLDEGDDVLVEDRYSNDYFYKVSTYFGITGYCLKSFIEI